MKRTEAAVTKVEEEEEVDSEEEDITEVNGEEEGLMIIRVVRMRGTQWIKMVT